MATSTVGTLVLLYADHYGINPKSFYDTLWCESKFNIHAWNKSDPHGGAKGVAQFLPPTFKHYAPLAGIEDPNIWNPEHNIQTAAYMFSIGEQKQWVCFAIHTQHLTKI